jgi:hypothetical protein
LNVCRCIRLRFFFDSSSILLRFGIPVDGPTQGIALSLGDRITAVQRGAK